MADHMNDLINNRVTTPIWMTTGRAVLCKKDQERGSAVDNYRPISYLPLAWKRMTGMIGDSMCEFFVENDTLPVEQKGCRRERAEAQKISCWLIKWSLLIAKESTKTWLWRGWTIRKHTIWCLTLQLKNGTGSGKYNNFSAEIHGKLEDRTDILWRDTWFS